MPTFQSNPLYGPGGYDMLGDDGAIYPDPDGIVKAESDPTGVLAQTAALAPQLPAGPDVRLASNGADMLGVPAGPPLPGSNAHEPPPPASLVGSADAEFGTVGGVDQSGLPPPPAGQAPAAGPSGAPAGPPDPASIVGAADKTVTTSTSGKSEETGSTGLSPEDAAKAAAGIDQTAQLRAKAADAGQATSALEAQQASTRSAELLAGAAGQAEKIGAEQALNEHLNNEVERKLKAGADFRPDRTELFGGDNGLAFGISAAVAAMCGGWLMGLGKTKGNPYLDVVLKLIDDNANDQIRKNSATVQELMRQKGDLQAVKAELKSRLMRVADQTLEARMLRDKSQLIQTKGAETRAQIAAQDSQWQNDQRKALMRTETKKISKTLNTVTQRTSGGAADASNEARQARIANLRKLDQRINTLRAGIKSGAAQGVVGITNMTLGPLGAVSSWLGGPKSVNEIQRLTGTMSPEKLAQLNNLNDLGVDSVVSLKNEPSPRIQKLIVDLNMPQSDAELETFVSRLEAARNALAEDLRDPGQYTPAPQPQAVEAGPR